MHHQKVFSYTTLVKKKPTASWLYSGLVTFTAYFHYLGVFDNINYCYMPVS